MLWYVLVKNCVVLLKSLIIVSAEVIIILKMIAAWNLVQINIIRLFLLDWTLLINPGWGPVSRDIMFSAIVVEFHWSIFDNRVISCCFPSFLVSYICSGIRGSRKEERLIMLVRCHIMLAILTCRCMKWSFAAICCEIMLLF